MNSKAELSVDKIMQMPVDKRYRHLLEQIKLHQQLWILTDEHGAVMLNDEDEDCVPVWPNKAFAQYWASGDWETCKATPISLEDWLDRWTDGLEGDELFIAVCPNPAEDALVIEPSMFDEDLRGAI